MKQQEVAENDGTETQAGFLKNETTWNRGKAGSVKRTTVVFV